MKYLPIILIIFVLLGGSVYMTKNRISPPTSTNPTPQGDIQTQTEQKVSYSLDLSNTGLKKVPMDVFSKVSLESLDVSNNQLEGSLQAEIRHLQKLKILDLSNNKFSGVPAEIGQLQNLEVLNLSNNQITGLPYELGNLSNLKLLDLSGNQYSEADLAIIQKTLPKDTIIKTR